MRKTNISSLIYGTWLLRSRPYYEAYSMTFIGCIYCGTTGHISETYLYNDKGIVCNCEVEI